MTCQRPDPTGVTGTEEEAPESPMSSTRGSPRKGGEGHVLSTLPTLPDPLGQLLGYIFHPNNKAEIDVLLKHAFFVKAKYKSSLKAYEEPGYAHPNLKLKKKDIELFSEAATNWAADLMQISQRKIKEEEAKIALREMRKKGSMRKSRKGSESASPYSSPAPAPVSSMAAPPVVNQPQSAPPPTPSSPTQTAPPPVAPPPKAPPPAPAPPTVGGGGPPKAVPPPPPPGKIPPPAPPPPGPGGAASPPPVSPPKGVPPPPPPKKAPPPPPSGGPPGGGDGARNALLEEIRRGTSKTFRGD